MADEAERSLGGYAETSAGGQFLSAGDIPKGKTVQKKVRAMEWQTFEEGDKPALLFEDETTLVLNKTNAGYLVDAEFSEETLEGVVVTLTSLPVMYKGEQTMGIRIVGAEKE